MTSIQKNNDLFNLKNLAYCIIFAGVCFLIGTFIFFSCHDVNFARRGDRIDLEKTTGPIGDFIGGIAGTIFSLASAVLVVATLKEQNRDNRRDHFVQNYFEMLRIHNENVARLKIHRERECDIEGREVFTTLVNQYNNIFIIVHGYMENILKGGLHGNEKEKTVISFIKNNEKRAKLEMRIAYGYFFFGSDTYNLSSTANEVEATILSHVKSLLDSNNLYFSGHSVTLGHYYRQMYQMVMLIINESTLNEGERYTYAKQLRAQLNDNEQLLLYYNAMADVGSEWLKASSKDGKINSIEDTCPLVRFAFLKNIPNNREINGYPPEKQFNVEISRFYMGERHFFEHPRS